MENSGGVESRPHPRDPGAQPQWRIDFERQAHRLHAEFAPSFEDQIEHRRMQMKVLVRVDMIEREPAVGECLELRANFSDKLFAHVRQEEKAYPVAPHVAAEAPMFVEQ